MCLASNFIQHMYTDISKREIMSLAHEATLRIMFFIAADNYQGMKISCVMLITLLGSTQTVASLFVERIVKLTN